ncbi:MAG: hypothetical protein HOB84_03680 [Candidatus Marinimicrobia bacterium]|jgi:hypothetical protein|nr:hypothetical protein [Candidatus Neomarinimicrobiota bacterium]MBT4360585.1 hypothetical protein [Candidatus Neomarinimicrobiota bacterium]MBT4713852.1 hypothetical protein [Candidatus Neomarinimicrobiota bacterium]MBT4945666.1 hypothetical protein [Candidatus Neomarinimicrobiota bacterium]
MNLYLLGNRMKVRNNPLAKFVDQCTEFVEVNAKRFFSKGTSPTNSSIMRMVAILLMAMGIASGQAIISGSITYVSKDNAYIDLGKKVGVASGDSITVVRDGVELGLAIITQASGSSSALKALEPVEIPWIIGDGVKVTVQGLPEEPQPTIRLIDTAQTPESVKHVFLDSSAYVARSRSGRTLESDRFKPSFSGYVSSRLDDRGGDPNSVRRTTGSVFGQFKVLDLGIRHLDASVSLRSSQASTDTSFDAQLYSLMLTYNRPEKALTYRLGRMYHPQFSMLGTVDGLGLTWRSTQRTIALMGGREAPIFTHDNRPQRNKYGVLDEEHFKRGSLQVGSITEQENGELARSYLLLGSTYRVNSGLRLRAYSEVDLDLRDQSATQSFMALTRFRASLNWRPWRSVVSSLRYSYRENVIDLLDTTATEFDRSSRHALNSNLSWMTKASLTISGQVSYRTDGIGNDIQIYGLTLRKRSFTKQEFSLSTGSMLMLSYLSEGGRFYGSLGKRFNNWLDVDVYDEVFFYRILGESDFRIRHLPEISLAAKVPGLNRLRLRTRFEQEDGELFYRVGLSASRQF